MEGNLSREKTKLLGILAMVPLSVRRVPAATTEGGAGGHALRFTIV
jgi:hypothetical protein